jgi:hypothetical protein
MNHRMGRLLCLGLVTGCSEGLVEPARQLPVEIVVDTPAQSARFERPLRFSPLDVGPARKPAVALVRGGALAITGLFFTPSATDGQFYQYMGLSAVRERFYQGAEVYDSTGAIRIVIDGGQGGGFAQIGAAQYTSHIYGMLPGRYRLTIELQGVVYGPGVLVDSIIDVP